MLHLHLTCRQSRDFRDISAEWPPSLRGGKLSGNLGTCVALPSLRIWEAGTRRNANYSSGLGESTPHTPPQMLLEVAGLGWPPVCTLTGTEEVRRAYGPRQVLGVQGQDSLTHSALKQYLFLSMNPDQLSLADRKAFKELIGRVACASRRGAFEGSALLGPPPSLLPPLPPLAPLKALASSHPSSSCSPLPLLPPSYLIPLSQLPQSICFVRKPQ